MPNASPQRHATPAALTDVATSRAGTAGTSATRARILERRRRARHFRARRRDLLQDAVVAAVLTLLALSVTAGLGVLAMLELPVAAGLGAAWLVRRRTQKRRREGTADAPTTQRGPRAPGPQRARRAR